MLTCVFICMYFACVDPNHRRTCIRTWWRPCYWIHQNKSLAGGTFACRCHSFSLVCEQCKLIVHTCVEGTTNKDGGLIWWDTRRQDYITIYDTSLLSTAAPYEFHPPKRDAFYVTLDQRPCNVHELVGQFYTRDGNIWGNCKQYELMQ